MLFADVGWPAVVTAVGVLAVLLTLAFLALMWRLTREDRR